MATARIAYLRLSLRGFPSPSTATSPEGRVELGRYWVLEEQTVGADTFARLELSHFGGGDTWICTASGATTYADLVEAPKPDPRRDFSLDPQAIDESKLTALFSAFDGFTYDHDDGHYPWPLSGVTLRTTKKQNNCCTFVEALAVKAFEGVPGFGWSLERHNQMMINVAGDAFAPVTAAVESGIAVPASGPDTPPQPWSIVQGWRATGGGHTFFVVDHDVLSDRVLLLESNAFPAFKLDGPGYRCFGALEGFKTSPPPLWHQSADAWTWAKVCSYYPKRLHAGLRVSGRKLSGLP